MAVPESSDEQHCVLVLGYAHCFQVILAWTWSMLWLQADSCVVAI